MKLNLIKFISFSFVMVVFLVSCRNNNSQSPAKEIPQKPTQKKPLNPEKEEEKTNENFIDINEVLHKEKQLKTEAVSIFTKLDKDKDGKITRKDFDLNIKNEFKSKDKNKDKKLSKEECIYFDKYNNNADSYVSLKEFTIAYKKLYHKIDANKDGIIDKEEMDRYLESVKQ